MTISEVKLLLTVRYDDTQGSHPLYWGWGEPLYLRPDESVKVEPAPATAKYPYMVWVIVAKDRDGKPRGFEKTAPSGKFFMTEEDANDAHSLMDPLIRDSFTVTEALIGYPD